MSDERRQRAEHVDEDHDQRVDGRHAKSAQDRKRKPERNAGDHDGRGDLDRHHHALHDGRQVALDHLPLEEGVEKARPSRPWRSQRASSATKARVRASLGAEEHLLRRPLLHDRPRDP